MAGGLIKGNRILKIYIVIKERDLAVEKYAGWTKLTHVQRNR